MPFKFKAWLLLASTQAAACAILGLSYGHEAQDLDDRKCQGMICTDADECCSLACVYYKARYADRMHVISACHFVTASRNRS
jgi:hypothetical protein